MRETSVGVGPDSPSKDNNLTEDKLVEETKQDAILPVSYVLRQVKLAKKPVQQENLFNEADLKREWMLNFLKNKGFEFSYDLFFKFKESDNKF